MKVAELKIGMMVKPIDPNDRFLKSPTGGWITVARKRKSFGWPYSIRTNSNVTDTEDQKIAVYLGRKKDIGNTDISWSDRFVLFENKILAMDPPSWRKIEIAYE